MTNKHNQTNVVVIEQDGINVRTMTINIELLRQNIDIRKAIKAACTEFVQTPEGKRIYEHNCGCFNWADFASSVPAEICEKHGFRCNQYINNDIEVNWDEHLVDDDELNQDDEQS